MDRHCFDLNQSRLALSLQLLALACLLGLWFIWLEIFAGLILFFLALIVFFNFLRKSRVTRLEQLSDELWTVKFDNAQIQSDLKLNAVYDHAVYILLEFNHSPKQIIIWRDQVPFKHWKQLKVLAHLN